MTSFKILTDYFWWFESKILFLECWWHAFIIYCKSMYLVWIIHVILALTVSQWWYAENSDGLFYSIGQMIEFWVGSIPDLVLPCIQEFGSIFKLYRVVRVLAQASSESDLYLYSKFYYQFASCWAAQSSSYLYPNYFFVDSPNLIWTNSIFFWIKLSGKIIWQVYVKACIFEYHCWL